MQEDKLQESKQLATACAGANMPTEAELDDLVLSRHRTTLKLAWEAELREDLEDGGDDDAASTSCVRSGGAGNS